jgi:hypothetical protein
MSPTATATRDTGGLEHDHQRVDIDDHGDDDHHHPPRHDGTPHDHPLQQQHIVRQRLRLSRTGR